MSSNVYYTLTREKLTHLEFQIAMHDKLRMNVHETIDAFINHAPEIRWRVFVALEPFTELATRT